MRAAVDDEVISRNPCQVKGAAVEKAPERPVASIAEVQALADGMPEHLRVAVFLAAWCQLRRAELRGLRRRDVNTSCAARSQVNVTHSTRMDGITLEKAPKTDAGRRTIAIPANMIPALTGHLQRHVGPEADAPLLDCTECALARLEHCSSVLANSARHWLRSVVGVRDKSPARLPRLPCPVSIRRPPD